MMITAIALPFCQWQAEAEAQARKAISGREQSYPCVQAGIEGVEAQVPKPSSAQANRRSEQRRTTECFEKLDNPFVPNYLFLGRYSSTQEKRDSAGTKTTFWIRLLSLGPPLSDSCLP